MQLLCGIPYPPRADACLRQSWQSPPAPAGQGDPSGALHGRLSKPCLLAPQPPCQPLHSRRQLHKSPSWSEAASGGWLRTPSLLVPVREDTGNQLAGQQSLAPPPSHEAGTACVSLQPTKEQAVPPRPPCLWGRFKQSPLTGPSVPRGRELLCCRASGSEPYDGAWLSPSRASPDHRTAGCTRSLSG